MRKILSSSIFISLFFIFVFGISYFFITRDQPKDPQNWICPFCSGQTLFESNHPLAAELQKKIDEQKELGVSIEEIFQDIYGQDTQSSSYRYTINKYAVITLLSAYILKKRIWR